MFRRTIALVVALLAMGAPLLACFPNSSMTPAEMECCKKMAGNCDMGGGNHKCCDVSINHSVPSAAIVESSNHHKVDVPAIAVAAETRPTLSQTVQRITCLIVPASTSPPGSPAVLRL